VRDVFILHPDKLRTVKRFIHDTINNQMMAIPEHQLSGPVHEYFAAFGFCQIVDRVQYRRVFSPCVANKFKCGPTCLNTGCQAAILCIRVYACLRITRNADQPGAISNRRDNVHLIQNGLDCGVGGNIGLNANVKTSAFEIIIHAIGR
jgi:hypothetical protein